MQPSNPNIIEPHQNPFQNVRKIKREKVIDEKYNISVLISIGILDSLTLVKHGVEIILTGEHIYLKKKMEHLIEGWS